jgi:hypothetical protein
MKPPRDLPGVAADGKDPDPFAPPTGKCANNDGMTNNGVICKSTLVPFTRPPRLRRGEIFMRPAGKERNSGDDSEKTDMLNLLTIYYKDCSIIYPSSNY